MGDNVLIIGGGGREHALGWKIAQSPDVENVVFAPGNAGTEREFKSLNLDFNGADPDNFELVHEYIETQSEIDGIDLIVVGPEAPLAAGFVDFMSERGYDRIVGCSAGASDIEADKFFSADLMWRLGIRQANYYRGFSIDAARHAVPTYVNEHGVVLKARGLHGGKGVYVANSLEDALQALDTWQYGDEILVSERLVGEEFSVFGISDGEKVLALQAAFQDHKPIGEGDTGLNTGGMGAYGPAPIATLDDIMYVQDSIMTPTIQRMAEQGTPFKGFLYVGLMKTPDGIKVIEYNCRFGDPEAQPAMMLMSDDVDLYHVLQASVNGVMSPNGIDFKQGSAITVVMASEGYPGKVEKGKPLVIPSELGDNVVVFHSGTTHDLSLSRNLVTNGGRVLGVTAYSDTGLAEAQETVYAACDRINEATKAAVGDELYIRRDIGNKALAKVERS